MDTLSFSSFLADPPFFHEARIEDFRAQLPYIIEWDFTSGLSNTRGFPKLWDTTKLKTSRANEKRP